MAIVSSSIDTVEPRHPHASADNDYIGATRDICAMISDLSAETESLGTMPESIVSALKEAGLFWMLIPRSLGGGGSDLLALVDVIEELSFADGSTGWSFMANASNAAMASAFCGDDAVEQMFCGPVKAITAGVFGPSGHAVEVPGGYRASGKFGFGSGCAHATWVCGGMLVAGDDGNPRLLENGLPEVRVSYVPIERAKITGNWNVMGLIGTGSYDFEIPEQFVPSAFTLERTSVVPLRGGPVYELGAAAFACAGHAAVVLGLAKRALHEIAMISSSKKRPMYPAVVSQHPNFLYEFGLNEAAYHGCREYLYKVFADAQRSAAAGEVVSAEQRARFRQATTWAHMVAADVVRRCHMWAGSAAIGKDSRLGRCLRDMYVATQHVFVDPVTITDAAPAIMQSWLAPAADGS